MLKEITDNDLWGESEFVCTDCINNRVIFRTDIRAVKEVCWSEVAKILEGEWHWRGICCKGC